MLCALAVLFAAPLQCRAQSTSIPPSSAEPKISSIRFNFLENVEDAEQAIKEKRPVAFRLEISGVNFGTSASGVDVELINAADGSRLERTITLVTDTSILVNSKAPVGATINPIKVIVGGKTLVQQATLSLKPAQAEVKEFEFKMAMTSDPLYKNLYSLVLTTPEDSFAAGVSDNTVDIVPAGYSNLQVLPTSNTRRLLVTFLAPEKFEVKDVITTVHEANKAPRKVIGVGKVVKEFKASPNQPKIESTEILFLQRNRGLGRLKIVGSGFGKYAPMPVSPEDMFYVWLWRNTDWGRPAQSDCDNEAHAGSDDPCAKKKNAEQQLAALYDILFSDLPLATQFDTAIAEGMNDRPGGPLPIESLAFTREFDKLLGLTTRNIDVDDDAFVTRVARQVGAWRADIRQRLRVSLVPRNTSFRVDDVRVLYADDKMVDVVFRFSKYNNHSEPFRLAGVTVDVVKPVTSTQKLTVGKITATAESKDMEPFVVSRHVGPKMDENLEYRYNILDHDSARYLFGRGVSENFFVIQLSLVNKGSKKVAVPLAAIQAEVEWRSPDGSSTSTKTSDGRTILSRYHFIEGPATLPPMPLAGVSGYFDVYTKTQGKKARFFNVLQGMTILSAQLIPFFGPGFKDAQVVFTSGLIPGLKTAVGDLSGQQLQNLTALSWENVQVVPAAGGSMEKFLYIPRKYAITSDQTIDAPPTSISVSHIWGLEVTGYEVVESEAMTAAPQQSGT